MAMFQVFDDTRGPATCRSCQAKVTFFEMAKSGKTMPFDGAPVYVKTELRDGRLVGYIDGSMFASHFSTCQQASDWRRR